MAAAALASDRLTRVEVAASLAAAARSAPRASAVKSAILLTTAGDTAGHAGNFILDDVTLATEKPPPPVPARRAGKSHWGFRPSTPPPFPPALA